MTETIEDRELQMQLCSDADGSVFELPHADWMGAVSLAEEHGWYPSGACVRAVTSGAKMEFGISAEGDYAVVDGEFRVVRDWSELADALERALPSLPLESQTFTNTYVDLEWRSWSRADDKRLRELIEFCRKGPFTFRTDSVLSRRVRLGGMGFATYTLAFLLELARSGGWEPEGVHLGGTTVGYFGHEGVISQVDAQGIADGLEHALSEIHKLSPAVVTWFIRKHAEELIELCRGVDVVEVGFSY